MPEVAVYTDPVQVGGCTLLEPDAWSGDKCTLRRHLFCAPLESITETTARADGSFTGTESRILPSCSGTYAVTWTRQ